LHRGRLLRAHSRFERRARLLAAFSLGGLSYEHLLGLLVPLVPLRPLRALVAANPLVRISIGVFDPNAVVVIMVITRLTPSAFVVRSAIVGVLIRIALVNHDRNRRLLYLEPRRIPIIGAIPSAVAHGVIRVAVVVDRNIGVFDDGQVRRGIDQRRRLIECDRVRRWSLDHDGGAGDERRARRRRIPR